MVWTFGQNLRGKFVKANSICFSLDETNQ